MEAEQDLIEMIYGTLDGNVGWSDILANLSLLVGAERATFFETRLTEARFKATYCFGDDLVEEYLSYYHAVDAWAEAALLHTAPQGVPLLTSELIDERRLVRSEFYGDFLAPSDMFHGCGILYRRNQHEIAVVNMIRSRQAGDFSQAEARSLSRIGRHINTAVRLADRLGHVDGQKESLRSIFNRISYPCFVVDEKCTVLEMNAAAERLAQADWGLLCRNGVLRADDTHLDQRLRHLVTMACMASAQADLPPEASLLIKNEWADEPALSATVFPVRGSGISLCEPRSLALVTVSPASCVSEALVQSRLGEVYRLTAAECRALAAVMRGMTTSEMTVAFGITEHTVRTHMKSLHEKLGVTHRVDLVRKAFTAAPWWLK